MAKYVDGFVLPVAKKNVEAYKKMAREASKMWKKHGALEYKECVLEDAKPAGVTFTFKKAVDAKPTETIVFAYIVFKSRKHRDEVNAKVMADSSMDKYKDMPMPFDMKRMVYGGFEAIVEI